MADAIVTDREGLKLFHLLQLKYAMLLEMRGLKHSQGSAYAFVKRTFKLRGNRQKVYDLFCDMHGLDRGTPNSRPEASHV